MLCQNLAVFGRSMLFVNAWRDELFPELGGVYLLMCSFLGYVFAIIMITIIIILGVGITMGYLYKR